MALVSANILALSEIAIIQVFLHALNCHWAHFDTSFIARNIGISHILGVSALTTTLDHGQLLRIEVIFRVCCETSASWFFIIVLVVPNGV